MYTAEPLCSKQALFISIFIGEIPPAMREQPGSSVPLLREKASLLPNVALN
jgi:hypothetical protein